MTVVVSVQFLNNERSPTDRREAEYFDRKIDPSFVIKTRLRSSHGLVNNNTHPIPHLVVGEFKQDKDT